MFTSKREEDFLLHHINKGSKVLEYGSGDSTKELAEICKSIVSIEHQKEWYDKNIVDLPENCELILKEPSLPYEEGGHCGTYEEFKDYVEAPMKKGLFDVIIIDGRARVACASVCKLMGHKDTIVFIHDFERLEYQEALQYLELVDRVENMAKFKIKHD